MKKTPATDLLDALRATMPPVVVPPGYYTVRQLAIETGAAERTVRDKLAALKVERQRFKPDGRRAEWFYRLAS